MTTNLVSLHFYSYHVQPPAGIFARQGLLLKFQFEDHVVGFADLMPWPELGDQTLAEELSALARGQPTDLGQRVLNNAYQDGVARLAGLSLWQNSGAIPQSHYLVNMNERDEMAKGDDRLLGFPPGSILKIKYSENLNLKYLSLVPCRFRIDFNERGTRDSLALICDHLIDKIDFIEDPFKGSDPKSWQWLKQTYPTVRLFGDFALVKNPDLISVCDGIVLKPASHDPDKWLESDFDLCVTHSMGHPLGQMLAAWFAAKALKMNARRLRTISAGLLPAPKLINPHPSLIKACDDWNSMQAPAGQGFGFETKSLMQLRWERA